MISLIINADTRPGCGDLVQSVGDHKGQSESCSLHGVRSYDFLIEGVLNKRAFFDNENLEVILYIDEHEPLPPVIRTRLDDLVGEGVISYMVCHAHDRTRPRWNDRIYLEALALATGDYVAHFDQDCAAFKSPAWNAASFYCRLVDMAGPKRFICQPTTLSFAEHKMDWASTRFFFCRRDALDIPELERATHDETYRTWKYGFQPALEHLLGKMGKVFYPPADWDSYMVFSWARYCKGLLEILNAAPYEQVKEYVLRCGINGPNDVLSERTL